MLATHNFPTTFRKTHALRHLLQAGLLASAITALANDPVTVPTLNPDSYDHPVKIACLGDSITQGVGTHDPATESYPAQLQTLLGTKYVVTNFGVGGRTLLRKQDPFDIGRALRSKPDVVVIMLGTNDSRQQTLDQHGADFIGDYDHIIEQFKALETHPKIWICAPVPMFPGQWKLSEELLSSKVIPAIQQVAKDENVPIIDLHTPFLNEKSNFPDTVHPNPKAAHHIAECVATALAGTRQ